MVSLLLSCFITDHARGPFGSVCLLADMLKTLVAVPVIRTDNHIFLSVLCFVRRTEKLQWTFHTNFHI